jgi:hypothetical protein
MLPLNKTAAGVSLTREEIVHRIVELAQSAELSGEKVLSGILLTVAGASEVGAEKHFARMCSKFIDVVKKAAATPVNPKKIN